MPQFDRLGNDMSDDIADATAEQVEQEEGCAMYDLYADELTGYEEHCRDEEGAYGDPRRCHRHPEVRTSSDDGMFDAPCGRCESEGDEHCDWSEWKEALVASGPTCDDIFVPWNTTRSCRTDGVQLCYTSQAQVPAEDEIPF